MVYEVSLQSNSNPDQQLPLKLEVNSDGFKLWCSAVVHAVLPNWEWYQTLMKVAFRGLVVDVGRLVLSQAQLSRAFSIAIREWTAKNQKKFWSPMPYITLAHGDDSKEDWWELGASIGG